MEGDERGAGNWEVSVADKSDMPADVTVCDGWKWEAQGIAALITFVFNSDGP